MQTVSCTKVLECLLLIEHRECRRLNTVSIRNHVIYCECPSVVGDCATNLADFLPALLNVNSALFVSIWTPDKLSKSRLPIDGNFAVQLVRRLRRGFLAFRAYGDHL